jgi:hypothetical protein
VERWILSKKRARNNHEDFKEVEQMHEIKVSGFRCSRCKHEWVPNSPDKKPKVCPRCKSPYWDRERKVKIKITSTTGGMSERALKLAENMNKVTKDG